MNTEEGTTRVKRNIDGREIPLWLSSSLGISGTAAGATQLSLDLQLNPLSLSISSTIKIFPDSHTSLHCYDEEVGEDLLRSL